MISNYSLSNEQILSEFIQAKAILKGHFILSSGLHSDTYIQCARVLMNPKSAEKLYQALAAKIINKLGNNKPDIVVSPAMGGVIIGYEIARQLGVEAIFCERVDSKFQLRRGFELKENQKVLIVEDVLTTGKSSLETFELVNQYGCNIIAEACLIDRSNDNNISKKLGVELISLIEIKVETFSKDNIPDHLKKVDPIKPGSRFISK
jgi:orotate phosphoribosyltransferase